MHSFRPPNVMLAAHQVLAEGARVSRFHAATFQNNAPGTACAQINRHALAS